MGYYMGDYYAGSRGDPGIGSFLSGLVGMIPGGGVISKAVRGVSGLVGAATKGRGIVKAVGGAIMKHPVLSAAGAAGVVGAGAVGAHSLLAGHHGKCRKTHINKHGKEVCNRRMNPCNPRALRRAIRRTHGFAKLAMRTIHLVHPKKKGRFGGFRKKKASR